MSKLNSFFAENMDLSKLELEKLAETVHKSFLNFDPSIEMDNCRTVCSIIIGPDGNPRYECRLECSW